MVWVVLLTSCIFIIGLGPGGNSVEATGPSLVPGLPWIWISMDISMCGYQT